MDRVSDEQLHELKRWVAQSPDELWSPYPRREVFVSLQELAERRAADVEREKRDAAVNVVLKVAGEFVSARLRRWAHVEFWQRRLDEAFDPLREANDG